MSQEEAQQWLTNWEEIVAEFNNADVGFWENIGISKDDLLAATKTWLTDRSKQNDADAFNAAGGIPTENLKTTSDNVKAKVEDGTLTSATADTDTSY
jgi:hypothetical protein